MENEVWGAATHRTVYSLTEIERLVLDDALRAGVILMQSGAESYRVEDTVERMLKVSDYRAVDVVAILTGLYVTLTLRDGRYISAIKRIKKRDFNLDNIQAVNNISRHFVSGELTAEQAHDLLDEIEQGKRSKKQNKGMLILIAFFFTWMLGGDMIDASIAAVAAFGLIFAQWLIRIRDFGSFIPTLLQAFITTAVLSFIHLNAFPGSNLQLSITGVLLVLFPGTTMTNGIRDMLKGDYVSASANLLSALATAAALAIGVAFALILVGGSI